VKSIVLDAIDYRNKRQSLNLELLDYLGNYEVGPKLPDIGLYHPNDSNILNATTAEYDKLRVGDVMVERDDGRVKISATARYKPENEDAHETDQWGYTETEYYDAFLLTDLTEEEAILVEVFVPLAVEKADGFAGFRDNATKTNSILDRLKSIVLPDINDINDDLDRFMRSVERAEELDTKIERTDDLINEIVYDLYNLTDKEIEIIEENVTEE
jgi:type II restriction/modification system DNA methylase subunit YeeA